MEFLNGNLPLKATEVMIVVTSAWRVGFCLWHTTAGVLSGLLALSEAAARAVNLVTLG